MLEELVQGIVAGDSRQLGRAISLVETGGPEADELLNSVYSHTGHAQIVGMTGPPGSGKSTIVDQLIREAKYTNVTLGVLAVDPSSYKHGGAVLGDRIRMQEQLTDQTVFVRSMAARGALGGLATATSGALHILDAAGKDMVIIETVGVGQSEVDIASTADTTVLVLTPNTGDAIQLLKSGVLEIADIFVINKADQSGTDQTVRELRAMIHGRQPELWAPMIIETDAISGRGLSDLWLAIHKHSTFLSTSGQRDQRVRQRLVNEVVAAASRLLSMDLADIRSNSYVMIDDLLARRLTPSQAAYKLVHSK